MVTCKSSREVFRRAHAIGCRLWSDYGSRYSRMDFTRPQLFACLVLRERQHLSYREAEVFLRDVPDWLADIGMRAAPDHNTLWRAFGSLLKKRDIRRALDLMSADAEKQLTAALKAKPLTMDATCFEPRHRSPHYDRVCRKMVDKHEGKASEKPGRYGVSVNASRSRQVRRIPKLALAVSAGMHQILSLRTVIGTGSDAPDFEPLLFDAWKRAKVRTVVADAGYDSEANHCLARLDMGIRSIIPAKIGRPAKGSSKVLPSGYYRRLMKQRFNRKADARTYGQRAQSETTNSMIKRNLGEDLRSIKPERQEQEMMLRSLVHNLMLDLPGTEGRD